MPRKGDTGRWHAAGRAVTCTVCGHDEFEYREDLEGGRAMQYFGGPLFTPKVAVLQCRSCTYRMDFGRPDALSQA